MKVKCKPSNIISKKKFFLLMIVPFLIGLIIALTSLAQAGWNNFLWNNTGWNRKDDPLLLQSPQKQGWVQVGERALPSKLLTSQKASHKTASR